MDNFVRNYKTQDFQGNKRKAEESGERGTAKDLYVKRHFLDTFCLAAVVITTIVTGCNAIRVGWREVTKPAGSSGNAEPNYSGERNSRLEPKKEFRKSQRDSRRFREVKK